MEDSTHEPRNLAADSHAQRPLPSGSGGGRPVQGPAARGELGPIVKQFGPKLQEEFDELAKHETRILQLLADPELHTRFLEDPIAVLEGHGIPVGATLRRRLKRLTSGDQPAPPLINLPNGQVLKPKLRIRITGRHGK